MCLKPLHIYELKLCIALLGKGTSRIFSMLIFIMMSLESNEMKVWNMRYGHRAMNEE